MNILSRPIVGALFALLALGSCAQLPPAPVKPKYLLSAAPADEPAAPEARASDSSAQPGSLATALNVHMDAYAPVTGVAPEQKFLFANYNPDGRSEWSTEWCARLDFSGVTWDNPRAGTLISPQYMVMAGHYTRPAGSTVKFHDRNGQLVTRKIAGLKIAQNTGAFLAPDVAVARLDQPVPPTVRYYPVLPPGDYRHSLTGAKVLALDAERKAHQFEIERIYEFQNLSTQVNRKAQVSTIDPSWYEDLIVGDSGKPTFLVINGRLVLMSTHTTGGFGGSGPFYGGKGIQEFIASAARELAQ